MGSGAPALGDVVAGKYKITRFLGAGGMGVVVEAEHLELGQAVALKFLHANALATPGASERFLREARAAVRIRSEHVARVLDVGRDDDGNPFMVMECLDGRDLGQILQQDAPLKIVRAIGYVLQACEAIAVAHALGIVHRDLKPSNIFVTTRADGSPLVKVLDFGISKAVESEGPLALTTTGEILGSPIYMSPEQLRNTRSVDRRTDIWSLGTVLFELLTTRHPFEAESMPTLCAMIAADEPSKLRAVRPDIPEELERVILRCLEKKPANRFASVADLGRALLPFAGPDGLAAVGRITRIAAGTAATAASAVESTNPVPRLPPPHEATAPSPVALPEKPAPALPSSPPKRRWAIVAGPLVLAAISVAIVRVAGNAPRPVVADEHPPAPPLSSPSPSPLVANAALVAVEQTRTEAAPKAPPGPAPDAAVRVEPTAQPILKVKPHPTLSSSPSAVPPQTTEKLPLDPLIDQR